MDNALQSNISSTINGFFVGFLISNVLLGITLVQTWIYAHHNQDKWSLRVFIAILVLLDIAVTGCTALMMHHYLIAHFGDFDVLRASTSVSNPRFMMTAVIFFMGHIFLAYRLLRLTRSWWFPAIITLSSTAMLSLAASFTASAAHSTSLSDLNKRIMMAELTSFHVVSVVTDILITVGLSRALSTKHSGVKSTRMVLRKLLGFTVTRGILISIVQIGHIIMYLTNPTNLFFWTSLHLILTNLYVITTLVTLNSREALRDKLQDFDIDDFRLSFARSVPPSHLIGDTESSTGSRCISTS